MTFLQSQETRQPEPHCSPECFLGGSLMFAYHLLDIIIFGCFLQVVGQIHSEHTSELPFYFWIHSEFRASEC